MKRKNFATKTESITLVLSGLSTSGSFIYVETTVEQPNTNSGCKRYIFPAQYWASRKAIPFYVSLQLYNTKKGSFFPFVLEVFLLVNYCCFLYYAEYFLKAIPSKVLDSNNTWVRRKVGRWHVRIVHSRVMRRCDPIYKPRSADRRSIILTKSKEQKTDNSVASLEIILLIPNLSSLVCLKNVLATYDHVNAMQTKPEGFSVLCVHDLSLEGLICLAVTSWNKDVKSTSSRYFTSQKY